jgi:SNF2 family DNA or RNA helicase
MSIPADHANALDSGLDLQAMLPVHAPLRTYQWAGVKFLAESPSALLADEMGLGKTVQTAVAMRVALRQQDAGRALVVAPASLILNWIGEFRRWAPDLVVREVAGIARDRAALYQLPLQVLVASYEQIRADGLQRASEVDFDLVVLDEAQRIKNPESTTSLACRLLRRRRAWALTGTPLENSVRDMEGVFRFVRPGLLTHGLGRSEIHRRIAPFLLRRQKSEVLPELPPIILQDIDLELPPRQREAYDDLWVSRHDYIAEHGADAASLLTLFTRLKQVCNLEPASEESVKLEYLNTVLDGAIAAREKVLVFSQYVSTLKWLSSRLSSIPHGLFTGELSQAQKDLAVRTFESEDGPRVLLVSIKAGGVGLNLQSAQQVVLFDRWWNPAVEAQAIQRAHRFGRTTPLHVHRLIVQNSIEERIASILATKQLLFDQYVNEAESSANRFPTASDLLRILDIVAPSHSPANHRKETP